MKNLINLISERDNISEDQAKTIIEDAVAICRNLMMQNDFPSAVEEAWIEETGLEPDYLYEVLYSSLN